MGLLLSKYGIGPTEERVRVVLEAAQPTTATEVRSFRGMVGFSAPFIPKVASLRSNLQAGRPLCMGQRATMATGKCTHISLF